MENNFKAERMLAEKLKNSPETLEIDNCRNIKIDI